ncbi:hypothetical protein BDV12DRAFT_186779 [Aspergillus spectabilis]
MAKKLPAELILHVVDCIIPSKPPFLFAANHVVTHTLLSLMLVCRLTSYAARQLLIKHCLRIDSGHRLALFVEQGFVAEYETAEQLPHWFSSIELFLSPFPVYNLNIPATVEHVNDLSTIICNSLTRLIIDMPLRHLYPEDDDGNIRPMLRKAFSRMTKLVEFCSVRDELYLSTVESKQEPAIWSFWPNLQRLALYNVAIESSQFIEGLSQCLNLTHLVLVRPDGLSEEVSPDLFGPNFLPSLQRLMIVDTESGFLLSTEFGERMREEDTFVGRLRALRSPECLDAESGSDCSSVDWYYFLRIPFGRDEDDMEIYQEWLLDHATMGTLWEMSDNQETLSYGQPDTVHWKTKPRSLNASWTCDTCSAVFQRLDHFKRHTATHRTDKPFICDFCGSLYKRGDVLRRHWKSCSVRIQTGQAIPEPRLGGKEKHACDGCARLKRSCSGGQPCSECQSRGRDCSYERLGDRERNRVGFPAGEWGGSVVTVGHAGEMSQLPECGDLDRPTESMRSLWDLGPMNYYASADVCYKAYSRLP